MKTSYTDVALVALPYEVTTSFRKGTVEAPAAIVREIESTDNYCLTLARDPFDGVSWEVIEPFSAAMRDPLLQQSIAERTVGELMDRGTYPICLGGEHTVSLGPIRAARSRGPLGVVQLDAHADLRAAYEGSMYSHACVMRRVLDLDCPVLSVGVRTMCAEEAFLVGEGKVMQVDGRTAATSSVWYDIVEQLPERVYLSVDMDFFAPEVAPAVGTPEPGGPDFDAAASFFAYLFKNKDVVAADVVELMPSGEGAEATLRLAARLLGQLVGLRIRH